MPAAWGPFITTVGVFLDVKIPKTEQQTAAYIAAAYRSTILLSTISMIPGSSILNAPIPTLIEKGFLETFDKIKNEENITAASFQPLSIGLTSYWRSVVWNPLPPAPGFASPATGVLITNPGQTSLMNLDFLEIFKSPPIPGPGGSLFATKLAGALAKHLTTISGNYSGVTMLGFPGLFPWVSIV